MTEIQPDLSDKNRCISVHWTLPVQCVLPCTHYEVWHEAWHPETGNRIRYRRVLGVYSTQSYHDGVWHGLLIPPPPAKEDAQVAQLRQQLEAESVVYCAMRDERDRLAAELESATAVGAALSGQCDRLTARCEQQKRDHAETVAEVERVRELHKKFVCGCGADHGIGCHACGSTEYPCRTIRALDGGAS